MKLFEISNFIAKYKRDSTNFKYNSYGDRAWYQTKVLSVVIPIFASKAKHKNDFQIDH